MLFEQLPYLFSKVTINILSDIGGDMEACACLGGYTLPRFKTLSWLSYTQVLKRVDRTEYRGMSWVLDYGLVI